MNHRGFQKNIQGFTLVELLVVISIIGLLASTVLASLNSARIKADNSQRVSTVGEYYKAFQLFYDDYGAFPGDSSVFPVNESEMCLASTNTNCDTYPISAPMITALSPYIKLGPAFSIFEKFFLGGPIGPAVGPRYQCEIVSGNLCTKGYFEYYVKGNDASCGWGAYGGWQFDNGVECDLHFPGAPDGCDYNSC